MLGVTCVSRCPKSRQPRRIGTSVIQSATPLLMGRARRRAGGGEGRLPDSSFRGDEQQGGVVDFAVFDLAIELV